MIFPRLGKADKNGPEDTDTKQEASVSLLTKNFGVMQYYSYTKGIFEQYLINCLKIPIYKRFVDIYRSCFDDKIRTDTKAVVIFQKKMGEFKTMSDAEINQEGVEVLSYSSCASYIHKLIEAVLTTNNRLLIIGSNADPNPEGVPNALRFFRTIMTSLGELFFMDPFIFCADKCNGKQLKCTNQTIQMIDMCIRETIYVLSFAEEALDPYLKTLKNIQKIINKEENGGKSWTDVAQEEYESSSESDNEEDKDKDKDENEDKEKDISLLEKKDGDDDKEEDKDSNEDEEEDKENGSQDGDNSDTDVDDRALPEELAIITYKDETQPKVTVPKKKIESKVINLNDVKIPASSKK